MRIGTAALAALRSAAATVGLRGSVIVVCTVEGGVACRLVQGGRDDPALDALAALLIADLGYKTVEHAAQRQAVIRCTLPKGECRVDLGEGFMPVEVEVDDA